MSRICHLDVPVRQDSKGLLAGEPEQLDVNITTEFMKNQAPCLAFDPQQRMQAVEDMRGDPMLFSIGDDRSLWLTYRDPANGRWRQHDLTSGMEGKASVTAFEVMKDATHRLVVALVMTEAAGPTSTLYLTAPFSSDPSATSWADFHQKWIRRSPATAGLEIQQIIIGGAGGDQPHPVGIAVTRSGGQVDHCIFNTNATDQAWSWKKFPMPQNATKVHDLAVGRVQGDDGIYALCDTANGQGLMFTSLPDPDYPDKSSHYDFPLPFKAAAIAAVAGHGDSSDLYVAGAGVHLYPDSATRPPAIVVPRESLPDLRRIQVAREGTGSATIYVIGTDGTLHRTQSSGDDGRTWGAATLVDRGVSQITGFHNIHRGGHELFLVQGDTKLLNLYRDKADSAWHETALELPSPKKVLEYPTYTTRIHVAGKDGKPVAGCVLELKASSMAQVRANGVSLTLDSTRPVSVATDITGTVTVVQRVGSLSTPTYHLSGALFDKVIDIQPSRQVVEKLKLSARQEKWSELTLSKGGPRLIDNPKDAEAVQQVVQQLSEMTTPPSLRNHDGQGVPIAQLRGAQAPLGSRLYGEGISEAFGLSFGPGGAVLLREPKSDLLLLGGSLDTAFGDAMRWMAKAIDDVSKFVVKVTGDVAQFFVTIGDEIVRFVARTVDQVAHAVSWLFDKIKVGLEKLIQWLGFIFDWDDIKRVHRIMVEMSNQLMDCGREFIHAREADVEEFFEARKTELHAHIEAMRKRPESAQRPAKLDQAAQASDPKAFSAHHEAMASPNANWGTHHLQYSTDSGGPFSAGDIPPPVSLQSFVQDVFGPLVHSLQESFGPLIDDLKNLDMSSMTLVQLLDMLGTDLLIAILDIVKKLVLALMRAAEDLLVFFKRIGNEPIEIPLFSALYRGISGEDLSVLDLVCMIGAIPITIIGKLITGASPFAGMDAKTAGARFGATLREGMNLPRTLARGESPQALAKDDWNHNYATYGGIVFGVMTGAVEILNAVHAAEDCNAITSATNEIAEKFEARAGWISFAKAFILLCRQATFFPVPGQYNEKTRPYTFAVWGTYGVATVLELVASFSRRLLHVKLPEGTYAVAGGVVGLLETNIVMGLEAHLNDLETDEFKVELPKLEKEIDELYKEVVGEEPKDKNYPDRVRAIRDGFDAFNKAKRAKYEEKLAGKTRDELREHLHRDWNEEDWKIEPYASYDEAKLRELIMEEYKAETEKEKEKAEHDVLDSYGEFSQKSHDVPAKLAQNIIHCVGANLGALGEGASPFLKKAPPPVVAAVYAGLIVSGGLAVIVAVFQFIRIGNNMPANVMHRVY